MKIVKPTTLSVMCKPYSQGGKHFLVVALLGFFRLGERNRRFLAENEQWPLVAAKLPDGIPLDAVMPKQNAEWFLLGEAAQPGGKPAKELMVTLRVGDTSKRLRAIGNREWEYALAPTHRTTDPEPFTRIPLCDANAFGGPDFADNPDGTGYFGKWRKFASNPKSGRMPNIEYADEPITRHTRHYRPASVAPVDVRRPSRQQYAGTFNAADAVGSLPPDTDFRLFNCAPDDQQRDGCWTGKVRYELEGVHPDGPICGEMPRMRARTIVQRQSDSVESAEALDCECDTLVFVPGDRLGVAIYRGCCEIGDSDALDVKSVMAAYEAAADRPRSDAHYRDVMQQRLDPETALQAAVNDAQLSPPLDGAARAAAAAERKAHLESIDREIADFSQSLGGDQKPPSVSDDPLWQAAPSPAELQSGDADLTPFLSLAESKLQALAEQSQALRADYDARVENSKTLEFDEADALQRANVEAPDLEQTDGLSESDDHAAMSRRLRRLAPDIVAEESPAAAVGSALRQFVEASLQEGRALIGRDLAGADLSGLDLSRLDLREVCLERANLTRTNFEGADLRGAVFTGANMSRCLLLHARLDNANLSATTAIGAVLDAASMQQTLLHHADLSGAFLRGAELRDVTANELTLDSADLSSATLKDCVLSGLSAEESTWSDVTISNGMMPEARLDRADFADCEIRRSILFAATAINSRWTHCRFETVQLSKSVLDRADLTGVQADKLGLRDASLKHAVLRRARFLNSDFGNALIEDADARESWWHRCILMSASLARSTLRNADFYQSLCRKASLTSCDMTAAAFAEAETTEMDLDDATLFQTVAPNLQTVNASWI